MMSVLPLLHSCNVMWGTFEHPGEFPPKGKFFCKNRISWMPDDTNGCSKTPVIAETAGTWKAALFDGVSSMYILEPYSLYPAEIIQGISISTSFCVPNAESSHFSLAVHVSRLRIVKPTPSAIRTEWCHDNSGLRLLLLGKAY